jgi:hypothetical protein
MERLVRGLVRDLHAVPPLAAISFHRPEDPASLVNAMDDHQATMDAIRQGMGGRARATIPDDLLARANHLKAFGYFCDAAAVGIGPLPQTALLGEPRRNPDIHCLAQDRMTRQTWTLASGIDLIMADLRDAMATPPATIAHHDQVIVFLSDMPRDPLPGEPGSDWLTDTQAHCACLRASEVAVVILGWDARAHTRTSADIELNQAVVAAGLATVEQGELVKPYLGARFGVAAGTGSPAGAAEGPALAAHDGPVPVAGGGQCQIRAQPRPFRAS